MSTIQDRYARPRGKHLWVVAALLLAVVGGGWLVWTAVHHATPAVAGRLKAYTVESDTRASGLVTVDRRDPRTPARCFVVAQAVSYERVGEVTVDVPPGSERVTDVPVSLKTFKRATSVSLERCEAA